MSSSIRSMWCVPGPMVACLLAGWSSAASEAASAADRQDSTELTFEEEFGLIFVEVEFNAEPLLALLDTGANTSAVDEHTAQHLPVLEQGEVVGTTSTFQVDMVVLENLSLGERSLPVLRATRRDLSGLLAPKGRKVEMILGSDAFAKALLTLDFDARRLTLASGPAPNAAADAGEGDFTASVPMRIDNGIPTIEATLGDVTTWLRIDTGASLFASPDIYVNVPSPLWEELQALDAELAPTRTFAGTGATGDPVKLPVVPFPGARIGSRVWPRVFLIVQPRAGYFASPDAKGFVSNNFLEKLGRVTLDYRSDRLVFPKEQALDPGSD